MTQADQPAIAKPKTSAINFTKKETARYLLAGLQLGLLWYLVARYNIESVLGLPDLFPFVFGGFAIHALLPKSLKQPFFLLLFLAAVFYLFNPIEGLLLIGAGAVLIGLCHLPVSYGFRLLSIILASGLIISIRASIWDIEAANPVLPILGAMFMFRLMIYLYELKHGFKPASPWHVITYFFLLPNLVFPIFPIIDFKTYNRTYYNKDSTEIYQKGIRWIMRGFLHLMLYRIIYYHFLLSPDEVYTVVGLSYYMATTYVLVLRLSGMFHMAVGITCLFGFNLPQAFNDYFLASSFSDLWRRINIYWHDFIMKIFYYPIFFKLRKLGNTKGIFISVVIVFFITWHLHSFQWFWIKGDFPVTAIDAIFWMVFGLLLAFNSVISQKKAARKSTSAWTFSSGALHVAKVLGMFAFMSVIWTFWTSNSIADWQQLMNRGIHCDPIHYLRLLAIILFAFVLGLLVSYLINKKGIMKFTGRLNLYFTDLTVTILVLIPFAIYSLPAVSETVEKQFDIKSESILQMTLNARDMEMMIQGYYENLLVKDNILNPLTEYRAKQHKKNPDWKPLRELDAMQPIEALRARALIPNKSVIFKGGKFTTNSLGFRDREYQVEKPDNTIRIAVLGNSQVMGSGVNDDEVFENLLEDKLNEIGQVNFECWNYAQAKFSIIQQVDVVNHLVTRHNHDVLLYINNGMDFVQSFNYLMDAAGKSRVTDEYPFLYKYIDDPGYFDEVKVLQPYREEITKLCYNYIIRKCRKHNIIPVWIAYPLIGKPPNEDENRNGKRLAAQCGFHTITLFDVYDNHDKEKLKIAEWDNHPNKLGHQLIADRIYTELAKLYIGEKFKSQQVKKQ